MPEQHNTGESLSPQPIKLEASKTALAIIDMQNDFVDEKGALYGNASAALVPKINHLIREGKTREVPVIHTQDWHLPNDIEFKLWPKHCVKGTWGADLTDRIDRERNDIVVKKGTIDPWLKSTLASHLWKTHAKTLVVTGTVANICVLHAVAGAVIRGLRVVVPVDCIAPLSPNDLDLALRQFKQVYKCDISSAKLIAFKV